MTSAAIPLIDISASELVDTQIIEQFYTPQLLQKVLTTTLDFMQAQSDVVLPYFSEIEPSIWQHKPKQLGVYITDAVEGRALNLEARDKDYATNILSYPSELPAFIIEQMPELALGELIVCHEVVKQQAAEQHKTVAEHVTHLLVHGILHLLGFDHELGQAQQDEMEGFEIAILEQLGIGNPYLAR